MSRPRTAQEVVYWLEVGAGARAIRIAAVVVGTLVLSLLIAWKQFRGPLNEATLIQADVGRQLARGEGFTTQVNYPQTSAFLAARGLRFDPSKPYPELHQAPLYSVVIAGALRLLPAETREKLFTAPAEPPDGWHADYFLLGINVVLLWLAAWLTFTLGRRIFDARVGWTATLALLVSVSIWRQTVVLSGAPLAMVLALLAFHAWLRVEEAADLRVAKRWILALGAICGLLFLNEYSAGTLAVVALGYVSWRFVARKRATALALVAAGFLIVTAPWITRNLRLTGSPVALAAQNVALKFGDPTAEPASTRRALSAQPPVLDLRKLSNKTLTALQETVQTRLWSGGAFWFTAFFVVGWLYPFRAPAADRLRWVFTLALGVLVLAQAALNSGESDRLVTGWTSPLIMIFGAGFFFVLLSGNASLAAWPRLSAAVLLALQALPLLHSALEPRRTHFFYPPYFPSLFESMKQELARRDALGRFGIMADVPAGVAWYGDTRAWAQPPQIGDFYAISLQQPIGELLLTPRTLDRPFFTELNSRSAAANPLSLTGHRRGEWGEVYAGLLTGQFPRELPLVAPQKFADNLYVLLNPALPPFKGK